MSDIKRIVDRVTVLRDGHFIGEHLLSDITEEQLISELWAGNWRHISQRSRNIRG